MEGANRESEGRRFRVVGRVQGVGFRWWTRKTAAGLGLVGHVWNREDGSVEVWARGSPESLSRMEEALFRGPRAARVDAVEVSELGEEAGGAPDTWTEFVIV